MVANITTNKDYNETTLSLFTLSIRNGIGIGFQVARCYEKGLGRYLGVRN